MLEISSWRDKGGNPYLNKTLPRVLKLPKTAPLCPADIYLSPALCVGAFIDVYTQMYVGSV